MVCREFVNYRDVIKMKIQKIQITPALLDRSSSFSPANQGGACRGPDNGSSACRQESHHLLMMTSQYLMKSSAKKYHHINSDDIMEELAAKLSKTIILDCENEKNEAAASPRITDVKSFDEQIERICETLFQTLTSKQLERTYQRCLAIDLRQAGIQVLAEEAEIKLQYKGEQVATRKADIVLQTPSDKQWIVLELKAVRNLSSEHLKQLQFYMHHLDIDIGYLINFPHDTGFPDLPATAIYRQTILSGITEVLSDRNTRASNANAQVQIIKVERVITDNDSRAASPCVSLAQSAQTTGKFIVPIARTTGEPCKLCMKDQSYCRYHRRKG